MAKLPQPPSFSLKGKRALVTGAGRGIGLAAATALADAGAHVVLVARTQEEIEAAAAAIRDKGGSAEALQMDIVDSNSVRSFVGSVRPFNILVNNAGTNRPQPFLEYKIEDADYLFILNVRAAFVMAQAIAKRMVETKTRGSLIHVSSQMAFVAGPDRSVYSATKSALEGLSRGIALELAPYGIRSNTICPTFVETPMAAGFLRDAKLRNHVLSKIKLGRLGQVEDLMGAFVYLASDASSLMTGTHMVIDGGWTVD